MKKRVHFQFNEDPRSQITEPCRALSHLMSSLQQMTHLRYSSFVYLRLPESFCPFIHSQLLNTQHHLPATLAKRRQERPQWSSRWEPHVKSLCRFHKKCYKQQVLPLPLRDCYHCSYHCPSFCHSAHTTPLHISWVYFLFPRCDQKLPHRPHEKFRAPASCLLCDVL